MITERILVAEIIEISEATPFKVTPVYVVAILGTLSRHSALHIHQTAIEPQGYHSRDLNTR